MPKFIYIALELDGLVVAHFLSASDCTEFCEHGRKYTDVAYNLGDREPAPLVGTIYRA